MPIFVRFLLGVASLAAGGALVAFSAHGAYLVAVTKVGHGLPYTFGCIVGVMMMGGAWDLFRGPRAPEPEKKDIAKVHGAAQPASECEAQAAARGDTKSAPMHDQTFPD
jgi:hypothetical protein